MHPNAPAPLPSVHAAVLARLGWTHEATVTLPGRAAGFADPSQLPALGSTTGRLLDEGGSLYRHQALALQHVLVGRHTVMSTGTGSGKTRVFHLAAAEALQAEPRALVLAVYPGKALAREQAGKWESALVTAGLAVAGSGAVALLTGDQADKKARLRLLSSAKVTVLTPDVMHSWMLGHLTEPKLRAALARVRLIVLDEAHSYAGVFGSNSLWLFRRLQNALHFLHARPVTWLAASATLARPAEHLATLTGLEFFAVGESEDSSPRHQRHVHLVRPGTGTPILPGLGAWLRACTKACPAGRFAVFTQSRKQTEVLAHIANRESGPGLDDGSAVDLLAISPRLAPYRSGLSPAERADLQDRFARGELLGLACTSAFELGIDLPGLDLGFLSGMPESPASFWQRLGRFGRHDESHVFLVHDGSARTEHMFDHPDELPGWRARDAALYPENPILVARHVLCLAHEMAALGHGDAGLDSSLPFGEGFRSALAGLQRGELAPALRDARAAQGNILPHLAFPLRTIEETYTFRGVTGGMAPDGFVTYGQLLREAYPGAVYYHAGTPWRVTGLDRRRRELTVVRERAYRTEPRAVPPTFVPDLSAPAAADLRWPGGLRVIESPGRATESVTGFSETQGGHAAPGGDYAQGAYGQNGSLFRAYDTTGVMVFHPALATAGVRTEVLGELLRQALFLACPRETAEVAAATGALRASRRELAEYTRFLALYDCVPGSLRLTAAFAEPAVLRSTLSHFRRLAGELLADSSEPRDQSTLAAADAIASAGLTGSPEALPLEWPEAAPDRVFAPGTRALHRRRNLEVMVVRATTDLDGALRYDIRRVDDPDFQGTVAADALAEIPGRTVWVPLSEILGSAA